MKASSYFNSKNKSAIESAITAAERSTSGEIRVHIEDECTEDVLERAAFIFNELEMYKTEARNGVLIYLSYMDHKLAIIGDEGINAKVPDNFWEDVLNQMKVDFRKEEYTTGLIRAVKSSGEKLQEYFPFSRDKGNELDNEITFG